MQPSRSFVSSVVEALAVPLRRSRYNSRNDTN